MPSLKDYKKDDKVSSNELTEKELQNLKEQAKIAEATKEAAVNDEKKKMVEFANNYVVVYSPKLFNDKPVPQIRDIDRNKEWIIESNSMAAFPSTFARYLLDKYGFLQEVHPSQIHIVKKRVEEDSHKSFDELKKEKEISNLSQTEMEALSGVKVYGFEDGNKFVSYQEQKLINNGINPEYQEGIPTTSGGFKNSVKDPRDKGVEWYGPGLQSDSVNNNKNPMLKQVRVGSAGVFGA